MDQPANYYKVLGVTKASTNADVRQAYDLLVAHVKATTNPDSQLQSTQHLALLDIALNTLLTPDKRKRHDEKLDWFIAKTRLAAERTRDAAMRLKQVQDAAAEAQKAAQRAAQETTLEAALRTSAEAKRREELAMVEAAAAERFRKLREERSQFEDSRAAALQAQAETTPTQPSALTPQRTGKNAGARPYRMPLGWKVLGGSLVCITLLLVSYKALRQVRLKTSPTAALAAQQALALAPATAEPPAADTGPQSVLQPTAVAPLPKPAPAAQEKSAKVDSAKTAELLQYQKVLRRVEEEHPELNPDHAGHRNDLIAFVAARVNTHTREGYTRAKALEIAVRDLETQEHAKHMLEKYQGNKEKPPPEAPQVVLDKGEHPGYDPKCRWVTPEQWSCK